MAFKKSYYERKQVKHRAKYGKLEKRSELIERLKKNKEHKKIIIEAKNEIKNVTGKEYFFKYNSLKKTEGKVFVVENDTGNELRAKLVFLENEIIRVEKKLLNYNLPIQNKRYIFDDEGNRTEVVLNGLENTNDECEEYKKYLNELIKTKQEVCSRIDK